MSGPWSGFFGPDILGPVRGPVRGPDFHWSGPWSGFFGPDNPYRSGFFCGPVRGPDIFFFKIKKSGPDQFFSKKIGPVRILVRIFENKKSGPDQLLSKNVGTVRILVRFRSGRIVTVTEQQLRICCICFVTVFQIQLQVGPFINIGIHGPLRNIGIYGLLRNIGIHGLLRNIGIHRPFRI